MSDDTPASGNGWLSWDDLTQQFDPDTLRQLRPHLHHVGLDGWPCVEAERLDELLQMLELERNEP